MTSAPLTSRVLILDDDLATLTLERKILERAGYAVIGASTPESAQDAIEQQQPDIVLLDYRLDGAVSGLEFFRSMRAAGHGLPAILVTSFADEAKVIEALRAGIRDVVPKSGDYLDYLPQAVSRVFTQVKAERQVAESEELKRLVEALRASAAERERLLESERAARAESERASRLKDDFLATLSHELRTPLNAILGWSHLLRARPLDARQIAAGLETIERNARVQAQLVDDLLEMSRIISGKLRLEVMPLDLSAVIDAAMGTVRPAAEAKGIRMQAALDPAAGPIAGDPARIQQVLWNLLSNAIKFTPRDGRVSIRLARVDGHVEIAVTDTGQGITADFLPYLFDRFRQADSSTTREHRGMGLGLSIVKNLVEMHGGTVTAASAGEGQGATFVIALPLTIPQAQAEAEDDGLHPHASALDPGPAPALRLTGLRVLVVDDEADARELLTRMLTEYGAEVRSAPSAADALQCLASWTPNVLISDISMPRIDGYDLIRSIRRLPAERGGQTPALALTAFARSEDRQRALVAGYQAHLAKPAQPAELITLIASLAGRLGGLAS
jgi:signal transduction histidine kinase